MMYLLGATINNELVFGNFGITKRNGHTEFRASFSTVVPFTEDELEDAEDYYNDMLEYSYDDSEKYKLCEKFNCTPNELAKCLMNEYGFGPMDIRDCSIFPEIIDVDGAKYYFESCSSGQHDTRDRMSEYVNKEIYDAIHALWDDYHLKTVSESVVKLVERLRKQLDGVDDEAWIRSYIRGEVGKCAR